MPLNNPARFIPPVANTATNSTANVSGTVSTILPANSQRKGISFWNNGVVTVLVDVANTLTASSYQFPLEPGGYYESTSTPYVGAYFAITTSSTSQVFAREFT